MKPELVKLMALEGDLDRLHAHLVALMLKARAYKAAGALIDSFGSRRLWFWNLVADAIKDGAKWEPTTPRRRQIEAWNAAYLLAGRVKLPEPKFGSELGGWVRFAFNIDAKPPTRPEVKQQFKRLFPNEELPDDKTFERTFRELKLPWVKSKAGRTKGSKDSDKRRRRYNWGKKRVASVANYKQSRV